MVATIGSISIDLSTNVSKFAAGFKGAATTVERESGRMARSVKAAEASFASLARAGAGGIAGGLGAREIGRYADAWTSAGNKIQSAGQIAKVQTRSLSELNMIAKDTRTSFEATANLYSRLIQATGNLAVSEREVAQATELINKSFKAGGAAASEQAAGILQLSQALGSGVLQGDELRSLRENAPLLAAAIAKEFGTTIGGLKELGAAGLLVSDRVFKAIGGYRKEIEAAFGATSATLSDSLTMLGNTLTETIGKIDNATGFTKQFTIEAENLGSAIDTFVANPNVDTFLAILGGEIREGSIADRVRDYANAVNNAAATTAADVASMTAQLESLQTALRDTLTHRDYDTSPLLQEAAEQLAFDVREMKAELASLEASALSASNAIRSAFAQQYRELENRTMDAYNATANPAPIRTGAGRQVVNGVGVTRFGGGELNEVEDQLARGNDYQEDANQALQQIISEVQAGTRSINDLPQSISVNYNSIADAVRIGIISGMPRDESRQQYSISTGSGTAALERQIEELRLVQATVGSLASEQISQQIAQLELQLFRTQNPIGRGIGGGPYSGSVSYAGAFAEGGSFTVPGNQTGDTTNLLLRANGGEEVEVRPSGQSGSSIVINYTPDAFEPFSTSEQRARKIGDIITRATRRR